MNLKLLNDAKRIIVKIGSTLLVDPENGNIRVDWLRLLAEDLKTMSESGSEIIIVTSGAIAAGRRDLGLGSDRLRLEESQAAAASGQVRLAHAYASALQASGLIAAQVLLTIDDMDSRRRYLNARNTITTLLQLNAIPVINENDTIATTEIRFGDNDRLAAGVAAMMSADVLILLSSDIDGLYSADPNSDKKAEWIPVVQRITPEIEAMAGSTISSDSSGGMVTKLIAARAATAAGCNMVITSGKGRKPLQRLLSGGRSTWFMAKRSPISARKHWIFSVLQPRGELVVDNGAVDALDRGKSLLPAGVKVVEGNFERGDSVLVLDLNGNKVGRGLVAYSAADATKIIGHKTTAIEKILGYSGRDEMIHRDDLVLENEK
ncbi:MAG: glutamate 5-kinase [Gammaproteobacteria bacterium]|nr:glutamate 5-kinase [Gammaproteobacteria bacterium]